MADVHSKETRSRNMAAIKAGNTKPEMLIRRALHKAGFRYRIHVKDLPGKPDLVFRKHNAALFVNGCFWHRHDCPQFKLPKSRREFWVPKLRKNAENDVKKQAELSASGWRIGVVWECALKGRDRLPEEVIIRRLSNWLEADAGNLTVEGKRSPQS